MATTDDGHRPAHRTPAPVRRRGTDRLVCRTAHAAEGHAVEADEMTLDAASYVLEHDVDARRRSSAR
ncbi:hypothetical protein ACH4C2_06390 [Streptomyces sp. NPDC018057]|uniref:hypothetical protein n=1 Tax=unclassified Streptomyces TaxID=2593676 RepID=UPI00379E60FF